MLILQGKFQGSPWYRAAMLFALAVTGGTGFAQQQSYVDPSGQVLFASDETSVAIEFDSLLRRLEETEHRLRLLEARQGSMPGESSESGWDLHSASLQPSALAHRRSGRDRRGPAARQHGLAARARPDGPATGRRGDRGGTRRATYVRRDGGSIRDAHGN